MRCRCTYFKLIERGFKPIDHAWSCPLNSEYEKTHPKKRVMLKDNPYKEINRAKEDNPYAKKISKITQF